MAHIWHLNNMLQKNYSNQTSKHHWQHNKNILCLCFSNTVHWRQTGNRQYIYNGWSCKCVSRYVSSHRFLSLQLQREHYLLKSINNWICTFINFPCTLKHLVLVVLSFVVWGHFFARQVWVINFSLPLQSSLYFLHPCALSFWLIFDHSTAQWARNIVNSRSSIQHFIRVWLPTLWRNLSYIFFQCSES